MVDLLRVAFVNTSEDTAFTLRIETIDTVECCELLTTTPATMPEQNPGVVHPPGVWDLVMLPGTIAGFVSEKPVTIDNPHSTAVTVIYADGKDPWPLPPPLSPLSSAPDFETRYKSFLLGGAPPNPRRRSIVMTLAPARAAR
ncbi:MAG TPA: hypothetical protein VFK02_04710 [Kofleriaceae bacterium]|nr:hypothetical protein [Kofleriaceae bacterium]